MTKRADSVSRRTEEIYKEKMNTTGGGYLPDGNKTWKEAKDQA